MEEIFSDSLCSKRNVRTRKDPLDPRCLYNLDVITVKIQESGPFEFPFRSLLHESHPALFHKGLLKIPSCENPSYDLVRYLEPHPLSNRISQNHNPALYPYNVRLGPSSNLPFPSSKELLKSNSIT